MGTVGSPDTGRRRSCVDHLSRPDQGFPGHRTSVYTYEQPNKRISVPGPTAPLSDTGDSGQGFLVMDPFHGFTTGRDGDGRSPDTGNPTQPASLSVLPTHPSRLGPVAHGRPTRVSVGPQPQTAPSDGGVWGPTLRGVGTSPRTSSGPSKSSPETSDLPSSVW